MTATDGDVDRSARSIDRGIAPVVVSTLPFVGREREISALSAAVASARDGVGAVVCIRGEAGIGKTRLAHEVVSMARAAGFRCAWGTDFSDGAVPPLWPWQIVVSQLGAGAAAAALDTPTGQGETGSQRFAQFRAVVDAISGAASTSPIALVIDGTRHRSRRVAVDEVPRPQPRGRPGAGGGHSPRHRGSIPRGCRSCGPVGAR